MTYNIDIAPENQKLLEDGAARTGIDVESYILGVLEGKVQSPKLSQHSAIPAVPGETREERNTAQRARVRALRGKYSHLHGTVDDFLQDRHEEALREMQKIFS